MLSYNNHKRRHRRHNYHHVWGRGGPHHPPIFYGDKVKGPFGAGMARPLCNHGVIMSRPRPADDGRRLIKIRESLTCWWRTRSSSSSSSLLLPQVFHRETFIPNFPCPWWSSGRYYFEKVTPFEIQSSSCYEGVILAELFVLFLFGGTTTTTTNYGYGRKKMSDSSGNKEILKSKIVPMGSGSSGRIVAKEEEPYRRNEEGEEEIENAPYQRNEEEEEEEEEVENVPYQRNPEEEAIQDVPYPRNVEEIENLPYQRNEEQENTETALVPYRRNDEEEEEEEEERIVCPHQAALLAKVEEDQEDDEQNNFRGYHHKTCGCGNCPVPDNRIVPYGYPSLSLALLEKSSRGRNYEEERIYQQNQLLSSQLSRSAVVLKYGGEEEDFHDGHREGCEGESCPVPNEGTVARLYDFSPSTLTLEEKCIQRQKKSGGKEGGDEMEDKLSSSLNDEEEEDKLSSSLNDEEEEEKSSSQSSREEGDDEEEENQNQEETLKDLEEEEKSSLKEDEEEEKSSLTMDEEEEKSSLTMDEEEEKSSLTMDEEEEKSSLTMDEEEEKSSLTMDEEEEKSSLQMDEEEEKSSFTMDEEEEKSSSQSSRDDEEEENQNQEENLTEDHTGLEEISSDEMEEMFQGKVKVQKEKKVGKSGDDDGAKTEVPPKKEAKKKNTCTALVVKRGDPPVPWIVHPNPNNIYTRPWIRYPRQNLDPDGKILRETIKMCEELRKKYNELDKLWTGKSKRKRKTAFPTNTIGIRELIRNDRSKNRGTHLPCSTMHKIVSFAKLKRKVNFAKYVVSSSSSSSMPTTPMRTRKSSGGSGGTSGGRSHSLTWPRFVIKSKAKEEGGKKTVEKMGPDLNNNDNVATEDVDNITEDDDNVSEDVPNTMEDYANDFLDCRDGEEAIKSTPITTTWSHSSRQVLSTILGDMSLSSSESRQDNVEIPPKTRARSSSRSSREVKIVTTSSAKIRSKTASSSTGRSSHHHLGVPTKRSSLAHHPYQFRQPHQHHHHQPMSSYAYLLSKSQPLSIPPPPGFPPRPPQQQQQQQHSFNFGVMPAPQAQRHQQNLPTPQPEVEKQPYNHIPMTQQDMARKADLMFSQVMGVHYSHGHYSQWSPNSSFVGDNCSSSSSSSGGGYQNLNALPNMSSPQNNPYVRYQQQHNQYHGQNYSLLQIAQQSQQKLGLSPAPPPQQQQQQQFMPMMFSPQTGSGGPQNMNNNQPPPPRPLGWFCPAQQQPQPQQIQIPPPQQKKCVFLQRPQHGPMTNIYNPAGGIPPGGQTLGGMMIPSRIHYWQDVQDHNSRQQQHQHAVRNARVCYLNTVPQGQGQQQQQGQCQGQQVPFITQGNNVMLLSPPRHGVKTPHFHQQSSPQRHHKTSLRSVSSTGSILDPRPARQHKSPKSFTLWSDSTSTSSASSSDPPTPTGQPRSPDVGEGQSQGQSQDLSEDGDDVGLELLLP